jgi:hypothetical protein
MRPDRKVLLALALFAGAALAGFALAGHVGPEQVRMAAERGLSRTLGGPVRVESARLAFGAGVALEVTGLEAWPQADGPALRVARGAARIEPFALLLGRIEPRRIALDGASLRLVRDADGHVAPVEPLVLLSAPRSAPAPTAEGRWAVVQRIGDAARALLQAPLPLLRAALAPRRVEIRNLEIALDDQRAGARIGLAGVDAQLVRHGRGRRIEVRGSGRLVDAGGERGEVSLEGAARSGAGDVTLRVREVDLGALSPWLRELQPGAEVAGAARGAVSVAFGDRDTRRVRIELVASGLEARLPRGRGRQPLAVRSAAVVGGVELEVAPTRVELLQGELELDGQQLELLGSAARPLRPDSHARLAIRLRNLEVERTRQLAHALPAELERRLTAALARIERGRLTELAVTGTGTLAGWRNALEAPDDAGGALPVELEGSARFRDVAVRAAPDVRMEGLSGEVTLGRDRLEVRGLRRPRDLPELDVTIVGLDRLLEHGQRAAQPAPPLPGLEPLVEYFEGGPPSEGGPRGALGAVEISAAWLAHPAAVWPFEDLEIAIAPLHEGSRAIEGSGRWGGLAVAGTGAWRPGATGASGKLSLRLEVAGRPAPLGREDGWASGRWRVRDARWRELVLADAHGRFRADGPRLRLSDGEAALARGGTLRGGAVLDLSRTDEVPAEIEAVADAAALADLGGLVGLAPADLTGQLDAAAHLAGPLRPGSSARATLAGRISLAAARGELRRRPALASSIAESDDAFREFAGDKPFEFTSVQTELALGDGHLATDALLIQGSKARLVVSGRIRVDRSPHELEAVVAVFPRNAMNSIVGNVPVIGPILRGSDGNVVGAYLELTGPWGDPQARRLRNRSLAAGMLEGVPSFVVNGLRAIGSVLARLGPDSGPPPGGGS